MKTNISLRSIAALLLIAVPSMSIVSCTDDEDLASFEAPEPMVTVPAEEWNILGPTEFEKVGPDVVTASQVAEINEKYDINMRNISCSTNGRRKVVGTVTASAVGTMIAKTALDQVKNYAKAYAKKKVTGFAKKLFGIKEKSDPTMDKLNEISSHLGEIDNKLDDMTKMLTSIEHKTDDVYTFLCHESYSDFNNRRNNFARLNNDYIRQITFELEKEITDSTETESRIANILSRWANTTINGNPAYVEAVSYPKSMCEYVVSYGEGKSMNLCTLYDKIVYDSFPWENLGYESREQFRALQSMETIQGLELAYLYWSTQANMANADVYRCESNMREIESAIESVAQFFEANEIVYNKTKAICQIKGSHFEMDLKDGIKRHPDLIWKDGKPCSMKDTELPFLSGVRSSSMSDQELKDAKSHCLTLADADHMRTYFNNYLGKQTTPKDWFTLAGIDMSAFSDCSHIVTSDSYASFYYHIGLINPFTYNIDDDKVYLHFRNLVNMDGTTETWNFGIYKWMATDPNVSIKVRYGDVEKKNSYKTDEADEAWHTIKIKNSTGLTFGSDLLTLTLNRLN